MGTRATDGVKKTMEKYDKKDYEEKCKKRGVCPRCGRKFKEQK